MRDDRTTSGGRRGRAAASAGPELLLRLDRGGGRPLRDQLEAALRAAVRDGRLGPGSRLPPTRTLAADLGLSRGVVVEAYAQLVGEGYLEARRGSGTRVAATVSGADGGGREHAVGWPADAGAPGRGPATAPAPAPAPAVAPARLGPRIDFRPGIPDLSSFPRAAWAAALRRAALETPAWALGYGEPAGAPALRTALAAYLGRVRGVVAGAGGVMVIGGFSQALALLARVLPGRLGPALAVEDPGSPGQSGLLERAGLELVPIGVDAEGLRVDELASSRARVVIVTPAHQFPTGVVLSPARRAALLAWARARDGLIVEDDYDAEYRYDREPVGAVQGLAPDRVLYAGSVSKTLAPSLRLGWMVPPAALLPALVQAKHDTDLGSPTLEQLAFAELLSSGAYDRHLRRSRARQRRRRDALVAALRRHAPALRVLGTAAGLHALVELPAACDEAALVRRAAAAGVGLHGLAGHHAPGRATTPGLVLGYAALPETAIADGIRVLAELLG
jgi:GntR family transcriptional regulator/MocR family aminotransferase